MSNKSALSFSHKFSLSFPSSSLSQKEKNNKKSKQTNEQHQKRKQNKKPIRQKAAKQNKTRRQKPCVPLVLTSRSGSWGLPWSVLSDNHCAPDIRRKQSFLSRQVSIAKIFLVVGVFRYRWTLCSLPFSTLGFCSTRAGAGLEHAVTVSLRSEVPCCV